MVTSWPKPVATNHSRTKGRGLISLDDNKGINKEKKKNARGTEWEETKVEKRKLRKGKEELLVGNKKITKN